MGERRYKHDFIKFLAYALSSNDETIDHLENLFDTKSLQENELYENLHERLDKLGRKINLFIQSVEKGHLSNN